MSAEDRLEAELRRHRQGSDSRRIPFPASPLQSSTPGFGQPAGSYNMDGISDQHTQQMRAPPARDPSPAPRVPYHASTHSPTLEAGGNTRSRSGNSSRLQPSLSVPQRIDDWDERPRRDREPQRFHMSSAKSRSPTPRSIRRDSQRDASARRPQPDVSQDMAEMKDVIETFTTNQLAGGSIATATMRHDLDHAMGIIEGRIGEDRTIITALQYQVDQLQSNQGDESVLVNFLRDQMYRVEQSIIGVRGSGTAAVNTLHNELMAHRQLVLQPATRCTTNGR